jgi:hypothetical protein
MDGAAIEALCEDLGIALPERVARPKATLERLSELNVVAQPMPATEYLAEAIRGKADRGEKIDPVAIVRAARETADTVEAERALQMAVQNAQRYYDLSFRGGGGLMPTLRAEIQTVYGKVRALPQDVPTTERDALHANDKARQAFIELEELAARHAQLRRLQRLLTEDDVQGESDQIALAFALFGDSKLPPPVWPSRVQPAEPAGPREPLARLRWLVTDAAQSWTPTGAELSDRYRAGVQAISDRMTASKP